MIEAVHAKVYSQLITTFIDSKEERDELFDSIETHPIIKKKAEWAFRYMNQKTASFSERLIAFMAIEGIFFAGSFAAIFWIRDRGILANSLGVANEYISRDETLHADFAVLLYKEYCKDLEPQKIKNIILSALEIEKEFITHCLPDKLYGMNQKLMFQYLEFVADTWLNDLDIGKIFNVTQPFSFMDTIGQKRKDLFFEKTRTNYARQSTNKNLNFDDLDLD
jgi:ribonucleotide reductase beta subunit family protein with ferritin-like domain